MNKRKFPNDVARYFHPEKSYSPNSSGIHQAEKTPHGIPVYNAGGTARKYIDEYGNVSYR